VTLMQLSNPTGGKSPHKGRGLAFWSGPILGLKNYYKHSLRDLSRT